MDDGLLFAARLQHIIEASLAEMRPGDRAARIAWCESTGQHGVRLLADRDGYRLEWGGRPLAVLEHDVFVGEDAYLSDLEMVATTVPDSPAGLG